MQYSRAGDVGCLGLSTCDIPRVYQTHYCLDHSLCGGLVAWAECVELAGLIDRLGYSAILLL